MTELVRLVALTQPKILTQEFVPAQMSPEQFIAYCARVSNPSNQFNAATSEKLLRYCVQKEHWSIFEMVHAVIEINTTRDIARQILRHRSFSFQEFSQRYADPTQLGFETRRARLQDHKNRQNSIDNADADIIKAWELKQQQIIHEARLAYGWAIENGVAKEQARSVLPEGCTQSRLYMSGTLRSWIHYCLLRMGNGTQKEHQEIAVACWETLKREFSFLQELEPKTEN